MKDKDTEYAKKLAKDLSKSIKQQKLVIFVGAGVSISQGYPNWDNYIEHLIKYWQGQILAESDEKKLGREHHLIFDLISKSDISNKRKVDLVNYELKNVFGEDFEKRRLDFERGYFKNLLPYSLVNPVLESLASLDAIFITSNYDYEIENHAKRLKNTVVTINDLNEFQHNKKGKLQFGDVLHIHGTPDCDIEYFVSSSADYSKTYLKGRNNFNKLVNWFKKTKPTVLFIGASLEEDEILSLLHEGSQNYALMKSENTGNSKVDEHYKKIVEGFFNSENHTQIIWYGDKFKDLPIFVERLVSDINKELGVHEFHSEWNNLLNPSREQERYNQSLDNISNDSHYLTSLVNKVIEINNNDLDNLLLKGILQGETLEKIRSGSFPVFWKFIAENIEKLNDDEWETIYGILIQGNQRCFMDDMYKVYCQAIENNLFDNKQVNELRKVLARDRDVINSSFNQDNTLLGYWFVNSFEYSNDYLYITDDQEIEVNLNSDCVKQLSQILSSSQHFNYYSITEYLKENTNIELFYKLVKSNKLLIEGKDFIENVPTKLLKTRLVQKILVQIDNETDLNIVLVNRLIDFINFSDICFGGELNTFVEKHRSIIRNQNKEILEKPYLNMTIGEGLVPIPQFSFLTQEDLAGYDEPKLLEILVNTKDEQRRSSFLEEETISETENFLMSILKTSNELSEKVSNLLENHVEDLYIKYKRLYVEIAISSEISDDLRNVAKRECLERFEKEFFDRNDENFFNYFVAQQNDEESIFEKLLTVDPNKLSTLSDDSEQLDMFHFINNELGSYLQCLISLIIHHQDYSPKVIQKVDEIEDSSYKEIAQGVLISEYDVKEIDVTYHTFLGYAYYHSTVTSEAAEIFTDIIKKLLKEKIEDNQILNKVYMIALECIDPIKEHLELSRNNYGIMINTIFMEKYEFKYYKQWLQELFKHDSTVNYLETISNLLYRDNVNKDRLILFIEDLKNYVSNYKFKLSLRGINYILNQENTKYFFIIGKYFVLLLENDKLENDFFYFETIKAILPLLSLEERISVLQNIQKQKNCPPPEIEELQKIISELNS
ncbi:SIR2 family NAD-dependent protein deacylase [Streptococcus mutans]|uniref:SIR2 family NAD-dependent protein deacylase n=1 Tax=Streptococcus mutans TaxID=1309 RepID=UPI001455CD6A|nr:SIR2 family protein [Streptococcus mutans]NLQ74368.1 hypothetical protein [Streptococcus mutans]